MPEEYTRICERPPKAISQGQPQHCQYEAPTPNQQNGMQYGYNHQQAVSYTHLTLPTNREV